MHVPTMVVDDQPDVRFLLKVLIDRANDGLVVVAEAATGAEAIEPERTEHTIRFGAGHPSRLVLTVVPDPPATGTPRPTPTS